MLRILKDIYKVTSHDVESMTVGMKPRSEQETLEYAMSQIHSVEDAIAYFAKNGSKAPIKYIHCVPARSMSISSFRPYELHVTSNGPGSPTLHPYSTVTATGIIQMISPGECDFISLPDFMHEAVTFKILRAMRFFRQFLARKVMIRLHSQSKRKRFGRRRDELAEKLLFVREPFGASLATIGVHLHAMRGPTLVNRGTSCASLADLCNSQASVMQDGIREIETFQAEVLKRIQVPITAIEDACASDERTSMRKRRGAQPDRGVLQQQRRNAMNKELISSYLRLANSMNAELVIELASSAVRNLASHLTSDGRSLISLSAETVDNTLCISPTWEIISSRIGELVSEISTSVGSFTSVVSNHRQFQRYSVPAIDPIDSASDSAEILAALRHQFEALDTAPLEAVLHMRNFASAVSSHDTSFDTEMDVIVQVNSFLDQIRLTNFTVESGVFVLDAAGIRDSLVASFHERLSHSSDRLVEIARSTLLSALDTMGAASKKIEGSFTVLSQFVDLVRSLSSVKAEILPELDHVRDRVADMHSRMEGLSIKVSKDDIFNFNLLSTQISDLKEKRLLAADALVGGRMDWAAAEMDKEIESVEQEAKRLSGQLTNAFVDKECLGKAPAIVSELGALWTTKLDRLETARSSLAEMATIIGVDAGELIEVVRLSDGLHRKLELFETISKFHDVIRTASSTDISKVDLAALEYVVAQIESSTISWDDTAVGHVFKESVDSWRSHKLPLVRGLADKSLKPRHWEKIFGQLGVRSAPGLVPTIASLDAHGLFTKTHGALDIVRVAQSEAEIESAVHAILSKWEDRAISITADQSAFLLNDENRIISQELGTDLDSIAGMEAGEHFDAICGPIMKTKSKLKSAHDTLSTLIRLQGVWIADGKDDPDNVPAGFAELYRRVDLSNRKVLIWFESIPRMAKIVKWLEATLIQANREESGEILTE